MPKLTKIVTAITGSFLLLLLSSTKTQASEGLFKLSSTQGQPTRCFAVSFLLETRKYQIDFSCRNLIYPPEEDLFSYVMWATPADGGKQIKLGPLGFGKGSFQTNKPFTQLFVTVEKNKQAVSPSGPIVMSGSLEKIDFLEESPTPTPKGFREEEVEKPKEEEKKPLSTREKLAIGLKRAGIIALFALIALIGLIFAVTRARR